MNIIYELQTLQINPNFNQFFWKKKKNLRFPISEQFFEKQAWLRLDVHPVFSNGTHLGFISLILSFKLTFISLECDFICFL